MKKASMREMQHSLKKIIGLVLGGEEVLVTKDGKTVARLVPESDCPSSFKMPEFSKRMKTLFPHGPVSGLSFGDILSEERNGK